MIFMIEQIMSRKVANSQIRKKVRNSRICRTTFFNQSSSNGNSFDKWRKSWSFHSLLVPFKLEKLG